MKIQNSILELKQLGCMPDESEENLTNEQIDRYAYLLKQIKTPINEEEAKIIVQLFPESGLYGVEWTLLHIFESVLKNVDADIYVSLIKLCPSVEWKTHLTERFNNLTSPLN